MVITEKKKPKLKDIHRKAKVNFPWLPPLQIQRPSDYLILSRCTKPMIRALEEIRQGLILMGSPAFATMKLLHVPGTGGESDAQVALYARFRGWQQRMDEDSLTKQRQSTELYAQGYYLKEIARMVKCRDEKVRFHIAKGLNEYEIMFDIGSAD